MTLITAYEPSGEFYSFQIPEMKSLIHNTNNTSRLKFYGRLKSKLKVAREKSCTRPQVKLKSSERRVQSGKRIFVRIARSLGTKLTFFYGKVSNKLRTNSFFDSATFPFSYLTTWIFTRPVSDAADEDSSALLVFSRERKMRGTNYAIEQKDLKWEMRHGKMQM